MRLIDADEVMKTINHSDVCVYYTLRMSADEIIEHAIDATKLCVKTDIEQLPTIDPVKHGRWVPIVNGKEKFMDVCNCSECGIIEYFNKGWKKFNFCPTCGAQMEGEE